MQRVVLSATLIAFFAVVQSASAQGTSRAAIPDSSPMLRRVVRAETDFLAEWRAAWQASSDEARPKGVTQYPPKFRDTTAKYRADSIFSTVLAHRFQSVSCLQFQEWTWKPWMVRSVGLRGMCPQWPPLGVPATPDVSAIRDSAISSSRRGGIVATRNSLIALLDTAAAASPGDQFFAGQRVRLLLDQGALDRALAVARACTVSRWWCSSLAGLVLYRRGDVFAADSAFTTAYAATGGDARCQWADLSVLIDSVGRAAYDKLTCKERDAFAERFWWMADPLFSEAGNERRAEHYARRVFVMLRSALPQDEFYHWRALDGGDAVAGMVMRYGWPSAVYWWGKEMDESISNWYTQRDKLGRDMSGHTAEPYTNSEYTYNRAHTVPEWSAINAPFDAASGDWTLVQPGDPRQVGTNWERGWPFEHFLPSKPIVQLVDEQIAVLRRDANVVLAFATDLRGLDLGRRAGDTVVATLYRSTAPESIERVKDQRVSAMSTLVVQAAIASAPALIAVEIQRDGAHDHAARARLGIRPPAPLSALARGETGISEPAILQTPANDGVLPANPDSALRLMLGSTSLPSGTRKIGVYWETYGISPDDTVELTISMQRVTQQGAARRVGIAMGVATDLNSVVRSQWTEPQAGHDRHLISSVVPIVARTIVLDISRVPKGEYALAVSVARPGHAQTTSRRMISLR